MEYAYSQEKAPDLKPLPIWRAKSFYFGLFSVAALLVPGLPIDIGVLAEAAAQGAGVISGVLAYRQRMNPKRRLVVATG